MEQDAAQNGDDANGVFASKALQSGPNYYATQISITQSLKMRGF